ncbi:Na+/H+ antiporter NhaC family protein [Bengtsoniella intestinalis]|uniref:Na+/H+ antiporter NhaC family protein n=1 Tax=Bengtsoniella intestinalis TaxID=3073143 RepID=UPI00391EF274
MLVSFALFLGAVMASLVMGINLVYPLAFGLAVFVLLAKSKGHSLSAIAKMAWTEGKTALIVIPVFLLIGMVMGLWRSSGTIGYFLYYGLRAISPDWFVLTAFVLTVFFSFALGTSFGVVGTAGVVLITLARAGGVPIPLVAGVILSGAYFGDRGSPMSSCATLVAACTNSSLYDNVRQMMKTAWLPLAITVAVYAVVSPLYPMEIGQSNVMLALEEQFSFHWAVTLPAVVIFALVLLKVPVKFAMALSAVVALVLTITLQGVSWQEAISCAVFGYTPTHPDLQGVLDGGGLVSMVNGSAVVLITSLYAGILTQLHALASVEQVIERLAQRFGLYSATFALSLLTGMVFCNQSVLVILTTGMLKPLYQRENVTPCDHAMDIANSGVMLAGLVPWCIALTIPLAMLGADLWAVPWAVYLYLVPLCYGFTRRFYVKKETTL